MKKPFFSIPTTHQQNPSQKIEAKKEKNCNPNSNQDAKPNNYKV
jgi:hypothetical protein